MTEVDLDVLREAVLSGKERGAGAHIRLAEALIRADQRGEAITVLKAAISSNVSETGSELFVVRDESRLRGLLAQLVPEHEVNEAVLAQFAPQYGPVVGPFRSAPSDVDRRVRASDSYEEEQALWAADLGFTPGPIETTAAKTRAEFLQDLRGAADWHLRRDAALMLARFGADDATLRALAEACGDPEVATPAYESLVKLLNLPSDDFNRPWCLVGSMATEGAPRSEGPYCPRPELARQVGLKWLRRLVARRCTGDAALEYTLPVALAEGSVPYRVWKKTSTVEPEEVRALRDAERWWAALLMLSRARTNEDAARVLAEYPELDPDPAPEPRAHTRYADLLRQGKLYIGGGTTTDMQWSISYRDGRYVRSYSDGFEVHEEPVEESYVLEILENRRYGHIGFPHPKPPQKAPAEAAADELSSKLLHGAVMGDLAHIDAMLGHGAEINRRVGGTSDSALVAACKEKQAIAAKHLIERGANVRIRGEHDRTALMYAAAAGDVELFELLLSKGASPLDVADDGMNALMYSAHGGNPEIARQLIASGLDVNAKRIGASDFRALDEAITAKAKPIIILLLASGANVNYVRGAGVWRSTPLEATIFWGDDEIVDRLLAAGADPSLNGASALKYVRFAKDPALAARLGWPTGKFFCEESSPPRAPGEVRQGDVVAAKWRAQWYLSRVMEISGGMVTVQYGDNTPGVGLPISDVLRMANPDEVAESDEVLACWCDSPRLWPGTVERRTAGGYQIRWSDRSDPPSEAAFHQICKLPAK